MSIEEIKDADIECVEKSSQLSINADEEKALVRKIDLYLLPTICISGHRSFTRWIIH